jgi:hypothetical protein
VTSSASPLVKESPASPPSNRRRVLPALPQDREAAENRRTVERRSSTIKLGAFTGSNVPLETHLAKLCNCSDYYGWSAVDRLCHLKASLEGNAASLLWELPSDCSEKELLGIFNFRVAK